MDVTQRPFRSVLYMPGSNSRALEKAKNLPADSLIFDLEDAVSPDSKSLARSQVKEALNSKGYGNRYIMVRVNGLDTPWGMEDIHFLANEGADALVIPKVEDIDNINVVEDILKNLGTVSSLRIWCMMETPKGILEVSNIAKSGGRLAGLIMGTSDLYNDLHARVTENRLAMMTSLGISILAARANNLVILDGVHLDLNDLEAFKKQCEQGADIGFDGKTLIHPKTLEIANEVFGPSQDDVAYARRIIEAHSNAEKEGKGVVLLDNKLIENLHVENAKRLVLKYEAIEKSKI